MSETTHQKVTLAKALNMGLRKAMEGGSISMLNVAATCAEA